MLFTRFGLFITKNFTITTHLYYLYKMFYVAADISLVVFLSPNDAKLKKKKKDRDDTTFRLDLLRIDFTNFRMLNDDVQWRLWSYPGVIW